MTEGELSVRRLPQGLSRDSTRTIARFFFPASPERARPIDTTGDLWLSVLESIDQPAIIGEPA